jgi:hypothetical protein
MRSTRVFALSCGLAIAVVACSSSSHQTAPPTVPTSTSTTAAAPATTAPETTAPVTTAPVTTAPVTTAPVTGAALPIARFSNWNGVKPSVIYFSGDAGNIVSGITWSSWTGDSAVGQGMWGYDDCNPNCAQGHVTNYPTTVKLSAVVGGQFTQLVEIQTGPYAHTLPYTLPSGFVGAGS